LQATYVFCFPLQRLSDKFLIPTKIERDVIINLHLHEKKPSFLVDLNET